MSEKILGMEHMTSAIKQRILVGFENGDDNTAPSCRRKFHLCAKPFFFTPKHQLVIMSDGQKKMTVGNRIERSGQRCLDMCKILSKTPEMVSTYITRQVKIRYAVEAAPRIT